MPGRGNFGRAKRCDCVAEAAGARLVAGDGEAALELSCARLAQTVVIGLYPSWDISEDALRAADHFLGGQVPPALRRLVVEGRAGVERSLKARAFDAG